jgi:hypothetical protein
MNCSLPKITYLTLRILLLVKICEAIYPWVDVLMVKQQIHQTSMDADPFNSRLSCFSPILKRVRSKASLVTYRSAIPLKLASILGNSAYWVAEQLVENWYKSDTELLEVDAVLVELLLRNLTVTVVSPGMLEFSFNDFAIASWLQLLMAREDEEPENAYLQPSYTSEMFYCQCAYARCSSLLRLARQTELYPTGSLPWLTKHNQLVLEDSVERELLSQLVTVTDGLVEENDPLKLAVELSQAFQRFEQKCRIFGAIQTMNPDLSRCRLGLVMITQRLLRSLLEQHLRVYAPLEL